jgi:hypothetical protein
MAVTLSQIRAWSTEHLANAAGYWNKTADQWEDAFLTMRNQSNAIAWQGAGGDALRQRTGSDLSLVSGKADQLRQAAGIARSGASDIGAAKQRVLYAVADAQDAGFDVGEDLSVSYTDHGGTLAEQAARQAQAEQMAGEIWSRAGQLDSTEVRVAGQLTGAAGGIGDVGFGPGGGSNPGAQAPTTNRNGVKLVDFNHDNPSGPNPPPFAPWDTPDGKPPPQPGLPQPGQQPNFWDQYKHDLQLPGQQSQPPVTPLPAFGPRPDPGPQPVPGPMPKVVPQPSFGQCVEGQVKANVGKDMIKSGYESAIKGAIGGAVGGGVITPEIGGAGAIPGAVLGFVGGFAKGLVEAPVKAAIEGAVECADPDLPIPGKP